MIQHPGDERELSFTVNGERKTVRAYPMEPLPALRPGMSAYFEYKSGER